MDGEGYLLQDAYVEAIKNMYTEDSLKTLVKQLAPDCMKGANSRAKSRYKAEQI